MAENSRRTVGLLGAAGVLSTVFFLTTRGLGVPRLGFDILVTTSVSGAVVAAGLNGYWDGNASVSMAITTLVAGGHLVATFLRARHAMRLPPIPPTYYLLVAVFACSIGLTAHGLGRRIASG